MNADKTSTLIANVFEMPYCKQDIKERVEKNIPIPSVGNHIRVKNIVSHRFLLGLKYYMNICNVGVVSKGLNEMDCEVDICGGAKNLEVINILAKNYMVSQIN